MTWSGTSSSTSQSSSSCFSCARSASVAHRVVEQLPQLERRGIERQTAGLDLREVENVVDDLQQGIGRCLHHAQVLALLAAQLGVERQLRHADDAVHRRPDFVAHVGEELALGAAAFLGPVSGAATSCVFTVTSSRRPRRDLLFEVRLMAAAARRRACESRPSISLNPSTSVPTSSLLLRSTRIVYDFSVVTVLAAAASRRIGREMNPCSIHATTNAMTVEPASTISDDFAEVAHARPAAARDRTRGRSCRDARR